MEPLISLLVDQPAAGADFTFTPSNQSRVYLWSIVATLTTDAVAGTRVPVLEVKDPTGNLITTDLGAGSQLLSSVMIWNWRSDGPVYTPTTGKAVMVQSCPGFWLPPGCKVSTVTAALDVADQWTAISAWYWVAHDLERAEVIASAVGNLGA